MKRLINAGALSDKLRTRKVMSGDKAVQDAYETAMWDALNEPEMTLNALRDEVYQDAVAHGLFEEFDQIADPVRKRRKLAMRIMEEAAEMYAAADDPEHYAEEAADVTLMTGDVCAYLGIDWHKAVMDKKAYNKTRPWKHGKE